MKVFLHQSYRGVPTNEQLLNQGTHELDNKLAQYLVDNGHATILEGDNEPTEALPKEETAQSEADTELETLRATYEELAGKRVYYGWDAETLKAKITELE